MKKVAIIIGAGPAGLTAAHELLVRTDVLPIVYEQSTDIGGISKTVNHHGYRMDIGGHRFFSKSDVVMAWWLQMLPLETTDNTPVEITYRGASTMVPSTSTPQVSRNTDAVMLVRNRLSRIFYQRKLYDYPITLNWRTMSQLGIRKLARIAGTYAKSQWFPRKPETTLEDFYLNRFGKELYKTFFENYTTKVWGVHPRALSADWGAQRVKNLSVLSVVRHALKRLIPKPSTDLEQKQTETSLIQRFLYPKYGPGQLWEEVRRRVEARGGQVHLAHEVIGMEQEGNKLVAVRVKNKITGHETRVPADYVLSSMPLRNFIQKITPQAPKEVRRVANGLMYRDFITIGILLERLRQTDLTEENWIYIHDPDVAVGRIQIFNNWSPHLVADPTKVWLGLEYFCDEGDAFWCKSDVELIDVAITELTRLGFAIREDVHDGVVIRVPKAYPSYTGTYSELPIIRQFLDGIHNVFVIGRNGMHRYNNQDHSMLTAMAAVDCIATNTHVKDAIWNINIDDDYHEEKK